MLPVAFGSSCILLIFQGFFVNCGCQGLFSCYRYRRFRATDTGVTSTRVHAVSIWWFPDQVLTSYVVSYQGSHFQIKFPHHSNTSYILRYGFCTVTCWLPLCMSAVLLVCRRERMVPVYDCWFFQDCIWCSFLFSFLWF